MNKIAHKIIASVVLANTINFISDEELEEMMNYMFFQLQWDEAVISKWRSMDGLPEDIEEI